MLQSILKLENALDVLKGVFLGTVEEETAYVYEHADIILRMPPGGEAEVRMLSDPSLPPGKPYTKITQPIFAGYPCHLGLYLTDSRVGELCKSQGYMKIVKIIDMEEARYGRTIFEVEVAGFNLALKVIKTVYKESKGGIIETPTQQEVRCFDKIPESLKQIFVAKYAQGRLYVDETEAEVILMEKMCKIDLQRVINGNSYPHYEKMGWWAQAIEKLIMIHDANWTHGDCHLGNILFTTDVGVGELKWIDPERMTDISKVNSKQAAVSKIQDIYHVLLHIGYVGSRLSGGVNTLFTVDFNKLYQRLKAIKNSVPSLRSTIWLSDIIMFDNNIKGIMGKDGNGTSRITLELLKVIENHEQYKFVDQIDFSSFLRKLTNKYYLDNVIHYLIRQIDMALTPNHMAITQEDLQIPSETPSSRMQAVQNPYPANAYPPQPKPPQQVLPPQWNIPAAVMPQQPAQQSNVIPLVLIIGPEVINVTDERGEQYGYYPSQLGFQLCLARLGTGSTLQPSTLYLMYNGINRQPLAYNGRRLRMVLADGRHLQVGIVNPNFIPTGVIDLAAPSPQRLA